MRWAVGALACGLAGMLLSACTGSSPTDARGEATGASGGGGSSASAPHAAGSRVTGLRPAAAEADAVRLAPQLIVTAELSVIVRSVSTAAARAESVAAAAGGRTDTDDRDSAHGSRPTAELVLRVPNPAVPSMMDTLAGLGRTTGRHLSTRDVTTQVADVASRVASARSAIASLRTLYSRAVKVSDVIRIEAGLSQREASLESLEARQRSLAGQVALATITVDLTQRRAPAPVRTAASGHSGFVGGLEHGWHAFTATATGLAVGLGAALPFLAVLVFVLMIGLVVRRRVRPRPVTDPGGE